MRIKVMRQEATLARRADAAYRRQKAALVKDGWSAAEAEDLLSHYDVNPARRRARALNTAAVALATGRGRNPLPMALVTLGRHMAASEVLGMGLPRRNPAHLHAQVSDPRLREASSRFHGVESETIVLDNDQRRIPPREVVLLGEEISVAYRPDHHSERAGAWEHIDGEMLDGSNRGGRRLVVADANGRTWTVPGRSRMKFKPDRGLEG